jgi:hypothetical protein
MKSVCIISGEFKIHNETIRDDVGEVKTVNMARGTCGKLFPLLQSVIATSTLLSY